MSENHPDTKIISVEKDKDDKEYEVKLSNRWEMTFDFKGNLVDLDRD